LAVCSIVLEAVLMSRGSRDILGGASRGVLAEIDERLKTLDEQLAEYEALLGERERLRAARATILGQGPPGQITQDDVAGYLAEHPGSRPREIAAALGVSAGRVSAHLARGKSTRFVSYPDGWRLRDAKPARGARS
jgi:transposase